MLKDLFEGLRMTELAASCHCFVLRYYKLEHEKQKF